MTSSSDYYIPSTADYDTYYTDTADASQPRSNLNNSILVVSIIILFCVIFFISSLHILTKWALRHGNNRSSIRRAHFFHPQLANSAAPLCSGLSKDAISQLPTFTYKAPVLSNNVEATDAAGLLECAVCLSEFQEDEKGRLLPSCKHSFHLECIDEWLLSHSTCPLCRAAVMPTITTSALVAIAISTDEDQQTIEEFALQGALNAVEARSAPQQETNAPNGTAISVSDSHCNASTVIRIPSNVLICGDSLQAITSNNMGFSQSSQPPLPASSSSARATRYIPRITIEIPRRQDINMTSPGCTSLPNQRSRFASPYEQSCSSVKSLRSPGLRESVKRMLNRQASNGQEGRIDSPKAYS